jgi:hypothetical protein
MASLESRYDGCYRVIFYWQRQKFVYSLGRLSNRDAAAAKVRIEENLGLLRRGILDFAGGDLGTFLLTGGKKTQHTVIVRPVTLGELVERYRLEQLPGAKGTATRVTEDIHLNHLVRLLGKRFSLPSLTTEILQEYVRKRSQEKGRSGKLVSHVTVKKEIASLGSIWNKWALPMGLVSVPAPTKNLIFQKTRHKAPFQTWDQIERRVGRGGLLSEEQAELWESVFLDLDQVEELLDFVKTNGHSPWVHVIFAFAAYTGARRSEMLRSQIDDFDLDAGTVLIREKKRDHSKEITFRTVPLATPLRTIIDDWLRHHPGGQKTLVNRHGRPILVPNAAKGFRSAVDGSKWQVLSGYHVLRHSFASNCCTKGIDARVIDRWLGHQTEEMRLRYMHLFPDQQQNAMKSVFG